MTNNQYVLLAGSKINAGDFLINHRAKELLTYLRPDRNLIELDAWLPISDEQLEEINKSKALILIGGPSVQYDMYPGVYPLRKNLNDINVPIIMLGTGIKPVTGNWITTHKYNLSDNTLILLNKINNNNYQSGVRDYHTLSLLFNKGFKNIVMSGCPALYSLEHIDKKLEFNREIKNITFSAGVNFEKSPLSFKQMKEVILFLKDNFRQAYLTVCFHHSIDRDVYMKTHNARKSFLESNLKFVNWLKSFNINYKDISGSFEKLNNQYKNSDFHIGYRLHAHLYMCSVSRPTVLIAEDGRGVASQPVTSSIVLNSHTGITNKYLRKMGGLFDKYRVNKYLLRDLSNVFEYEKKNNFSSIYLTRKAIDFHYQTMKQLIERLP